MHSADHSLSGDDTINVVKATVPQEATVTASGASAWVKRHLLLAFFVLAFAVTWVIVLPLLLDQNGFGLPPFTLPSDVFVGLSVAIGMTGSTILITAVVNGKAGVLQLLRQVTKWRVGF